MRITHNIPAIRAFNALNSTSKAMENSIRKLSSGLRINSAADDASGYAISEKMRSQVRGLDMASQNTRDGISFLHTAEGSLETINSMLQRMRELAVQSANDTLTAQDRGFIQLEVDQLRDQIDKIAHNTQFNRKRLLDGSSQASWSSTDQNVQVNINGGLMITDQFNQKINNEGNYRLEITTDPGQSQVQKSNIMSMINNDDSSTDPVICPADPETKLSELTSFVSSSGVNLLEEPQKITLTQGTKTTDFYIDKGDTLTTFAKKINDAIAEGLGQKEYTQDLNHFANYVYDDPVDSTSESVPGTIVIRSVVTGREGEITFSAAEEILNALSLNTIQESQESKFTANVYDAHSNRCIASGITAAKADFRGIITPAVDVKIDSMMGINTLWSESAKKFIQTRGDTYETIVHLTDNTTILQTGANMGEDFIIQLDDSGSHAIGIDTVNVSTRDKASQSITLIDRAIEKVASNRAKIGAYQNALEWTQENLETTSLNLSQAESRIRDADMAKEMMEFVRLQILTESGTAMLSQANGMPRSVLSLLSQ